MDPAVAGMSGTGGDTTHLDPGVSSEAPQITGDSGDISVPGTTVVAGGTEVVDGAPMDVNMPDGVVPAGVAAGEDFPEGPQGGGFVGGVPYHGEDTMDGSGGYGSADGGSGFYSEAPLVAATFPSAPEGTALRTVDEGVIEASGPDGGNTLWYNSAYFQEPDAPHSVMQSANGVDWYAMQQHADVPQFEAGEAAESYNQATFQQFMPGYGEQVYQVDGSHRQDGHFEVRNEDGSGTRFYDTAQYAAPRGDYQVFEDARGSQWYAIRGEAAVERRPVYEQGHAVYDGDIRISVKSEFDSYFIYLNTLTSKYEKWLGLESMRSGQPGVNAEQYRNYSFRCPNYQTQVKIASIIKGIDSRIAKERQLLIKLQSLKSGLLQQLFI